MPTYNANIIQDADITTPTSGTWTVPEADDAIREIKRIVSYNESVTAVSSYPYTVLTTDSTLYCTGAGGTVAAPQLSTVSTTGYQKRVVVINDSSGSITFDAYSTETVGGSLTYNDVAGAIAEFLAHGGTDWEVKYGMAQSILTNQYGAAINFGVTQYQVIDCINSGLLETDGQRIFPVNGILKSLYAQVLSNTCNGSTTVMVRKNAGDTSLTVAIPSTSVAIVSNLSDIAAATPSGPSARSTATRPSSGGGLATAGSPSWMRPE